jgi:hypothetical protein
MKSRDAQSAVLYRLHRSDGARLRARADHGGVACTVWHPGAPTTVKKSWAERLASPGGIRYGVDEVLAIDAWRCPGCGRVELFALRRPTVP